MRAPLLCLALLSAAAALAADAPKHTLRYKFKSGEAVRWQVHHQVDVEASVAGTTQSTHSESDSIKLWRVTTVAADGTATFENLVESVDMRQKFSGRMEVRYNSKTDKEPPTGFETVAKSVGVPLAVITLDPRGKVVRREKPGQKSETKSPDAEGLLAVPFPEEAVPVGHTWNRPVDLDLPGPSQTIRKVKTQQTFKLASVKDNLAAIEISTQVLTPIHEPEVEAQLVQTHAEGKMVFDIQAGRVVEQQLAVDKQVVGFRGQASSLHYKSEFREKLLP